MVQEICAVNI